MFLKNEKQKTIISYTNLSITQLVKAYILNQNVRGSNPHPLHIVELKK